MDRRAFIQWGGTMAGAALLARAKEASAQAHDEHGAPTSGKERVAEATPAQRSSMVARGQRAVVTPNGSTLPWRVVGRREGGALDRRARAA